MSHTTGLPERNEWRKIVAPYQKSSALRSGFQVVNSIGPYLALTAFNFWLAPQAPLLAALLAVLTAGFMVRIFIIQHDCGHGSFLKKKRSADMLGFLCGLITFTPYLYWRRSHNAHHASSGNLSSRGIGDIKTATIKEYESYSLARRIWYKVYRNPLFLFVIGAPFQFLILHRLPDAHSVDWHKERRELFVHNLILLTIVTALLINFGFATTFLAYFLPMWVAAAVGSWLFYVQHQYEDAYWEHNDDWNYTEAAIKGSSMYKLPKILQWFSGNIGYHHVHHLTPKIPNYLLEQCHNNHKMFEEAPTLTILSSIKCAFLSLWDEDRKRLISFSEYRRMRAEHAA
ncbi:MAG: fatty acid desaturase [Opitutales bacterium]|nr:fatty acid desaturase [Opitutales bacterium]NRA27859.1 fatty acid desaturase [Opitutales bacterium]